MRVYLHISHSQISGGLLPVKYRCTIESIILKTLKYLVCSGRWQFWQMAVRFLEVVRKKREVYNYIIYYYIYINIYRIIDFGVGLFRNRFGLTAICHLSELPSYPSGSPKTSKIRLTSAGVNERRPVWSRR